MGVRIFYRLEENPLDGLEVELIRDTGRPKCSHNGISRRGGPALGLIGDGPHLPAGTYDKRPVDIEQHGPDARKFLQHGHNISVNRLERPGLFAEYVNVWIVHVVYSNCG